ncbi:hypothetical protein CHS0354_000024 [Potamilus streckersoni]|uniref:RAP domain-containing protein n=1 Tax=Potamilus streckersoni TaxID=2493646 RepID=A0AAE0TI89_9BIVA|nr:hypothetical protein CHS0354_000024 [Potamilus streckersoni]
MAARRLLLSCAWKLSPCATYRIYSIRDPILPFPIVNVQNSSLLKIKMLHSVSIDTDDHQKLRNSSKDDSRSKLQRRSNHIQHLYKLYNLHLYQDKKLLARINKTAAQIETSFGGSEDQNMSELRRLYFILCESLNSHVRKSLRQDLQKCSYEDLLVLFSLARGQDTPHFDLAFLFGEELVRRAMAAETNREHQPNVPHYELSFKNDVSYYIVFFGLCYERKFVYLKFVSLFLTMIDNYFELVETLSDSMGKTCVMYSLLSIMAIGSSPPLLCEKLEQYVLKNLHLFSINDLGFVCMGFFTSRTKVTSHELMEKIAKALLDKDFTAVELMTFSYMFKTFRYTGYLSRKFYNEFGNKFVNSSLPEKCKLMDLMHIIQTYTNLHIYSEPMFRLLEKVLLQFFSKSKVFEFRDKDLSRVMEAFGTFLYEPRDPELYSKVEQVALNLATKDRQHHYPGHTVDILVSLVNLGRFPQQLVRLVFSPEFQNLFTDDSKAMERDYQLLLLDRSVRLEMPQYSGPWIPIDRITMFQKTASKNESKQKEHRYALLRSFEALKSLLGQDRVHCHCILPHINTVDIEIRLNKRMSPVSFTPEKVGSVRNHPSQGVDVHSLWSDIKKVKSPRQFDRLAIEFIGVNQCQRGLDIPLGPMHLKMRQLMKLGYEICMVYPSDPVQVRALDMSQKDLCDYWKKRLTEEYSIVF